jgi:FkbM family methyltransferase
MGASSLLLRIADRAPRTTSKALRFFGPLLANGSPHWLLREVMTRTRTRIPVTVAGLRVPWGDYLEEGLRSGGYEAPTVAVMENRIRPGMTVLDIGAHVGYLSTVMSRLVGPSGTVHSFEADPDTARYLSWNTRRLANVRSNAVALGDKSGSVTFYSGSDAGVGALRPPREDLYRSTSITVPMISLRSYLAAAKVSQIDFIKIDVEGAELLVLRPIEDLLRTSRPCIVIEFAQHRQEAFGHGTGQLREFLLDCGYELSVIEDTLRPLDPSAMPAICNVLATPAGATSHNPPEFTDSLRRHG